MTDHPGLFACLAAPFEPHEVKVRNQAGRQLHYITARTAMNRLDDVLGPENWWDEYLPMENSVLCKLTIRLPDGQPLTKADAGGYAGMADSGDDDKSGYSDAFKRAAVKFGVARYLYQDGVPKFVRGEGAAPAAAPPPEQPRKYGRQPEVSRPEPGESSGVSYSGRRPIDGRQLFAWVKKEEERGAQGLLKELDRWAKPQGFPFRTTDYSREQVDAAFDYLVNYVGQEA